MFVYDRQLNQAISETSSECMQCLTSAEDRERRVRSAVSDGRVAFYDDDELVTNHTP